MYDLLIYLLLGVLVAFSSNFLGLGGGVLVGPILTSVLFKEAHWSVGVALGSAFLVTLTNTLSYHKKGHVPWKLVLKVALPAAALALVSASSAQMLSEKVLLMVLGAVLVLLGVFLFYQKVLLKGGKDGVDYPSWSYPVLGGVSGTLSGMTGIGAGLLFMPFYMTNKLVAVGRAVACSNASMVFSTFVGSVVYVTALLRSTHPAGNPLVPILIISAASYGVSFWVRDFQGKLAERFRLWSILGILFLLGARTLMRAVSL